MPTVHYRVRGVKCGKCDKIHQWYKYRVWREGKKVKEEYVGKCDQFGNLKTDRSRRANYHQTHQHQQQQRPPQNPPQRRQRSPYEVLGISISATDAQMKAAYKHLVKKVCRN
jgi:hypothetical protein